MTQYYIRLVWARLGKVRIVQARGGELGHIINGSKHWAPVLVTYVGGRGGDVAGNGM